MTAIYAVVAIVVISLAALAFTAHDGNNFHPDRYCGATCPAVSASER